LSVTTDFELLLDELVARLDRAAVRRILGATVPLGSQ
jgi:hypothetical protein